MNDKANEPGAFMYILAWVLWGVLSAIFGGIYGLFLPSIITPENVMVVLYGSIGAEMVLVYVSFLVIYKAIFGRLVVSKVLMYIYTFGTFGALLSASKSAAVVMDIGGSPQTYALAYVVCWIILLFTIRAGAMQGDKASSIERVEPNL
jgi:hypothetical protein